MSISLPELTPAQESLFLTLGSRALDSRLPKPFLGDQTADQVLRATGYALDRFPTLRAGGLDVRSRVFDVAVRTKRLDDMVRTFVRQHPEAVVLDLGAGLDGRMLRVDPPATVDWYDVDFPAVADLRRQLLPAAAAHVIGTDLTDSVWLQAISRDRPAMVVADGLLPFMAHDDFIELLRRLTAHFPAGELALNGYSRYATWLFTHSSIMAPIASAMVNPGFNDPRRPESWGAGLHLLEEIFLTRVPEVDELPTATRLTSRLAAPSARASRMMRTMVLRYGWDDLTS